MTFEKLKALLMPMALTVLGWSQTPAGHDYVAQWPWLVPVLAGLTALAHAGDTLTDKRDWR